MKNDIGLTVSVPLFFNIDQSIDYETLERYLADVCQNNYISAIYSMAYNTRYRMLADTEVIEINRFISDFCSSHGKLVYVGHPYIFTEYSLRKYFESIANFPVSGVSMLYPERYYGLDEPIIDFLKMPNQFQLDTVLHEMKLISGFDGELINWPKQLLNSVFDNVKLVAIKEDSKDDNVTLQVLDLCNLHNVHCVVAGGGKRRAVKFFNHGLKTWLNGSTMFLPQLIDQTYISFVTDDAAYKDWYYENVEDPFFQLVVAKYGWHMAHKAALEVFGYGKRVERFPHATLPNSYFAEAKKDLLRIREAVQQRF
jgi:dihydrodipicolinate synthase/N-acetylneuraminate lyase